MSCCKGRTGGVVLCARIRTTGSRASGQATGKKRFHGLKAYSDKVVHSVRSQPTAVAGKHLDRLNELTDAGNPAVARRPIAPSRRDGILLSGDQFMLRPANPPH